MDTPVAQLRTQQHPLVAGDRVRVGSGKKVWRITEFWTAPDGKRMASLEPVDGYSSSSAALDRITKAES